MASPRVRLEVATLQHVHLVAGRMRLKDRAEVQASSGLRPAPALRASLRCSLFARTVFINDEAACIFGVNVFRGVPCPWVLSTDTVDRYPVSFYKASRTIVRELLERFPVLLQFIDARYEQALRWAARLGFEVLPAQPFGFSRLPFHPVLLKAS